MKRIGTVIIIMLVAIFLVACTVDGNKQEEKLYSYEELVSMSSDDLLDLFEDNGLVIEEDLAANLSREEIGKVLKVQFSFMIEGTTSLSSIGYMEMAKDVQRIYRQISK